jgi:hypothetical protein
MHNGFVSATREVFPQAVIRIDMFHVIKHLNDCISEIRRQLQQALEPSNPDYKLLKGFMHMLVLPSSPVLTLNMI